MAVLSKEELLQAVSELLGEAPDDNGLAIIENLTDTLTSYEESSVDVSEWETKLSDLDNSWRKRYKERFLSSSDADHSTTPDEVVEDTVEDVKKDGEELTFEDLFEKSEP